MLDRSLLHLKQAGIFANAKAILFGSFKGNDLVNIKYAIKTFAEDIHLPVFYSNNFGHERNNYPIIFGVDSEIIGLIESNYGLKMKISFNKSNY